MRIAPRATPSRKVLPMPTQSMALLPPAHRSRLLAAVAVVSFVLGALVAVPTPVHAATSTIVSLTFDDANSNQLDALPALKTNGMKATFYVPSGYVGAAGYMTRANLNTLKTAGHEIGGHTVNHPDLAAIGIDEARRQICTDRKTLTTWGFTVRSFAYPFASSTSAVEQAASDCGYRSARSLGDIRSRFGCPTCAYAESIPSATPFALRALDQVETTWTLADLQQGVLNAENAGGGWVQYTFHDVCANACSTIAVSPSTFAQFLTWLAARKSRGTVVKTVGDVVGGSARPVVNGPVVPAPTGTTNGVVNAGLETAAAGSGPACWMRGGWGTNSPTFTSGTPAHAGAVASAISMTGYSSGDAKLLPQFDLGQCSPTVTPGRSYSLRSWYRATVVTQFAVYLRSSTGAWSYWTSSPWFAATSTWTEATWTAPTIPAGYTGISFALTVFGNGLLRTDDLSLYDTAGAPPPAIGAAQAETPLSRHAPPPVDGSIEVFTPTESDVAG